MHEPVKKNPKTTNCTFYHWSGYTGFMHVICWTHLQQFWVCICQPWFFLPVLRMLESQCCSTAAAQQHRGAEGMPWFARQSYRGNVQWHYQKAPLVWSEFSYHCVIKWPLSDSQITTCTGLLSDFPILCVLLGERDAGNQLWTNFEVSPPQSELWVKQILDWFESWCIWLNKEASVA